MPSASGISIEYRRMQSERLRRDTANPKFHALDIHPPMRYQELLFSASYSTPQLHCTIVAIPGMCVSDRRFSRPELSHSSGICNAGLLNQSKSAGLVFITACGLYR
jgi:hypothetical protein